MKTLRTSIFRSLLLVVGLTATVLFVFCLIMPIQDYAMTEYKAYMSHPSPETDAAFKRKVNEESWVRLMIAAPFGAVALTSFVFRKRSAKKQ